MAVNYCYCQLVRRLGWAAFAYYKKEGAIQHPEVCKFALQYDRRPDGRFGVQVVMWNLGGLSGNGGEVCEKLRERMIDMCCLQEVRWRGQDAGDEWKGI